MTVTKILYGDRCYDFNYWERLVRWSDGTSGQAVDILRGQDREEAEYILKHLELHEQRLEELREKKESKTDENMKRLQGIAGWLLVQAATGLLSVPSPAGLYGNGINIRLRDRERARRRLLFR